VVNKVQREYRCSANRRFGLSSFMSLEKALAMPASIPRRREEGKGDRFAVRAKLGLGLPAIAWENWRARFNRGFGTEAEGFTEGTACPVHNATST
jgi:hypothetical protein